MQLMSLVEEQNLIREWIEYEGQPRVKVRNLEKSKFVQNTYLY